MNNNDFIISFLEYLSKERNFKPGICNPNIKNLDIINNENLTLQMDIKFFF